MPPKDAASAKSFEIDPELFAHLGAFAEGSRGALTPFSDTRPPQETERKQLAKLGFRDDASRHARALSVLASANRLTRVQLFSATTGFEYVVYFPADDDAPVSVSASNGKVRVSDPAATDDAVAFIAEMIGTSDVARTNFEAEMNGLDALVFAGLVDARRRAILRYLADGREAKQKSDAETIAAELGRSGEAFITLASIVRGVSGLRDVPSADDLARGITSLCGAGHATQRGQSVTLAEPGDALAASLLNVHSVFTVHAARASAKGREELSFSCAIAGLHDLLLVENVQGMVHLQSIASRALLRMAVTFLRNAAAIPDRSARSR
jgi:hypothetical protein